MLCKICHKNETDNTSGICDECLNVQFLEHWFDRNTGQDVTYWEDALRLANYLRQEKSKDRQKFIKILEGLKMKEWAERGFDTKSEQNRKGNWDIAWEAGYDSTVEEINEKIQQAINRLKDEK